MHAWKLSSRGIFSVIVTVFCDSNWRLNKTGILYIILIFFDKFILCLLRENIIFRNIFYLQYFNGLFMERFYSIQNGRLSLLNLKNDIGNKHYLHTFNDSGKISNPCDDTWYALDLDRFTDVAFTVSRLSIIYFNFSRDS